MSENGNFRWALSGLVALTALLWWLLRTAPSPVFAAVDPALQASSTGGKPATESELSRGEYLVNVGGCVSCHTDTDNGGAYLAGGPRLDTRFGGFYAPNITADRETGIGAWRFEDFAGAMRLGVTPGGKRYYPVFPYTSYTQLRSADLRAMFAYLQTVPPVRQGNRQHDTPWYINRFALVGWQMLFFKPGAFRETAGRDASWNRGAYIVNALAHCGECHTPRNIFGAALPQRFLAGAEDGPDGDPTPNITASVADGIGAWDEDELLLYLEEGELPDGDYAGGAMVDVIENSTGMMTPADLDAVVDYILSVPAPDDSPP